MGNHTYAPDTEGAVRVLIHYGVISQDHIDNGEQTDMKEKTVISQLGPKVTALRESIQNSVEMYMRIPVGGQFTTEVFEYLMRTLTGGLNVYGTGTKLGGSEMSAPLDEFDITSRRGTICGRWIDEVGVIGKDHLSPSMLSDGSDFSLVGRIERYQVLEYYLRFLKKSQWYKQKIKNYGEQGKRRLRRI